MGPRRSHHKNFSSIDRRSEGSDISYLFRGRMDFSRLITSIMTSLGAFKAWFPKEVDLFWIHISFVYANIYLSFYFEGPHSNFRYILVALKKDGNNVHFFDVLPHCGGVGGMVSNLASTFWEVSFIAIFQLPRTLVYLLS